MKHKVWFDKDLGTLRLELAGTFTRQDGPQFFPLVKRLYQGQDLHFLICDLKESGSGIPTDREYRRWLMEKYDEIGFDRIAMVNAQPAMRMLAKIVLSAAGKAGRVRFFSSVDDAENWIRQHAPAGSGEEGS